MRATERERERERESKQKIVRQRHYLLAEWHCDDGRFIQSMGNCLGRMEKAPANGSASSSHMMMEVLHPDFLNFYQKSCQFDPELFRFDKELQTRINVVLDTLAASNPSCEPHGNGHGDPDLPAATLSFHSLQQVTSCLLDIDQRAVGIILACKMDVWKNPQLFSLVQDYLDASAQTFDFCSALEKCLRKARDGLFVLQHAVKSFTAGDSVDTEMILREFRAFGEAETPFSDEFFLLLRSIRTNQMQMLVKLEAQRLLLDKKIKQVKTWRKVANVIFASALASVIICSVVVAALSAPPVVAAVAAAAVSAVGSAPIAAAGGWFKRLWKDYEDALKEQKEVASSMWTGTFLIVGDLDNIQALVRKAESELTWLSKTAELAAAGDDGGGGSGDGDFWVGMREMMHKLDSLLSSMEELGNHVNRCRRDVEKARIVVLHKIIKPPSIEPTRSSS